MSLIDLLERPSIIHRQNPWLLGMADEEPKFTNKFRYAIDHGYFLFTQLPNSLK